MELAGIGPGPHAAMILADLGADVVRVERPPGGLQMSAADAPDVLARGRRRVSADLKNPAGRDAVLRLASAADVLLEGYRPGVTERLGVGPHDCLARNPRLVYGRMTGWGQNGPLAAARRARHQLPRPDRRAARHRPCRRAPGPAAEPGRRLRRRLDVARGRRAGRAVGAGSAPGAGRWWTPRWSTAPARCWQMVWSLLASGAWRDERGANLLDGGAPFYDTYTCADGRHVAVGALEPQFYAELLAGLGPRRRAAAGAVRPGRLAAAARAVRRGLRHPDQGRVGGGVRRHRRLRRPGALAARGPRSTRIWPRARRSSSRRRSAAGPAPRFSRTPPELPSLKPIDVDLDAVLADWRE